MPKRRFAGSGRLSSGEAWEPGRKGAGKLHTDIDAPLPMGRLPWGRATVARALPHLAKLCSVLIEEDREGQPGNLPSVRGSRRPATGPAHTPLRGGRAERPIPQAPVWRPECPCPFRVPGSGCFPTRVGRGNGVTGHVAADWGSYPGKRILEIETQEYVWCLPGCSRRGLKVDQRESPEVAATSSAWQGCGS